MQGGFFVQKTTLRQAQGGMVRAAILAVAKDAI